MSAMRRTTPPATPTRRAHGPPRAVPGSSWSPRAITCRAAWPSFRRVLPRRSLCPIPWCRSFPPTRWWRTPRHAHLISEYVKFLPSAAHLAVASCSGHRSSVPMPRPGRPRPGCLALADDPATLARLCAAVLCQHGDLPPRRQLLLFAPRRWAMEGLKTHGLVSLWLLAGHRAAHGGARAREAAQAACLVASKHQSAWDTFALIPVFRDPAMVMKGADADPVLRLVLAQVRAHLRQTRARAALCAMVRDAQTERARAARCSFSPRAPAARPGAEPDYKPGYIALYEGLDCLRADGAQLRAVLAAAAA